MDKKRIPDIIAEIQEELRLLKIMIKELQEISQLKLENDLYKRMYCESAALKLHNFYTGCERIFKKIASDINGGIPTSFDWHKRLLLTMSLEIKNIRPPVIRKSTEKVLLEYLAFRHILRNIYGFELDIDRIQHLIENIELIYNIFEQDIHNFILFLNQLGSSE